MSAVPEPQPRRVMFLYWGRRGLTRFVEELAEAAANEPTLSACLSISRQNEGFRRLQRLPLPIVPVTTFESGTGVATASWRILPARRAVAAAVRARGVEVVVDLMPHAWSVFLAPAVRRAGARYVCVVHDARPHPGDPTAWSQLLSARMARQADEVVTLSRHVADALARSTPQLAHRISVIPHPELHYPTEPREVVDADPPPWRLLFLGRLLPYKGLDLFVEAVESLVARGAVVTPGVFGEGDLGPFRSRLDVLGARVANRWLADEELGHVLGQHDALIACHREASQSGTVAAAFGAGLPVVATPVGGLPEQVRDGQTGVVASGTTGEQVAAAVERLFLTPGLRDQVINTIVSTRDERSMRRFVLTCLGESDHVAGTTATGTLASRPVSPRKGKR